MRTCMGWLAAICVLITAACAAPPPPTRGPTRVATAAARAAAASPTARQAAAPTSTLAAVMPAYPSPPPTATAAPTRRPTEPPSTRTAAAPLASATPLPPTATPTAEPTQPPETAVPGATAAATATQPAAVPPPTAGSYQIVPEAPPVLPSGPWVYETTVTINSYGYEAGFVETGADDPVYPYPRMDFEKVLPPSPRSFKGIVLENGYVSVTILPELGGRVYSWVDKATGRQLLYQNPVLKPTNWGYRGWWLASGGIEWSFPVEEHGLNEWRPWTYSIGAGSVTVSDVESRTGMEVGATISLDGSHAYVTLRPWAKNLSGESQPYQLWLNGMVSLGGNRVSGDTQLIIPTGQVTIHSTQDGGVPGAGGAMSWPICGGRDMSYYRNWSGYIGFFAPSNGFVGLYDHANQQGMVRAHEPGWPAGTKLFGPSSLSPAFWTDDSSSYLELWSGATGSFWSYGSLEPGASVSWSERWYPVSRLGGFQYANRSAALRLSETDGVVEAAAAVSSYVDGRLTLFVGGQQAAQWPVQIYPGQAFLGSWPRQPGMAGDAGIRLTAADGSTLAQTGSLP